MEKDKSIPTANSSIILSLVLAMCFVMFVYSIAFHDEFASLSNLPMRPALSSNSYMYSDEDEDTRAMEQRLEPITLKMGSRKTRMQEHLQRVVRDLPKPTAWDAAIETIIAKAKDLLPKAAPAPNDEVTLVSAVFELGPDVPIMEINDQDSVVTAFLAHPQKKVLFVEKPLALMLAASIDPSNTRVVILDMEAVRKNLGEAYTDIIKTTLNRNWKYSVHWLRNTAQAQYPDYTAASMSKVFLLREASRLNPFNTKSFLWMDPTLKCVPPKNLEASKMQFFNRLFDRFFVSFFDYVPDTETHGFPKHSWNYFSGDMLATTHKVVKGWTFGGQADYIELTAVAFEILMRETLRQGQLGNADCVWSILMTRYPDIFHSLALSTACGSSTNDDFSCPGTSNGAGWCTPFVWSVDGIPS